MCLEGVLMVFKGSIDAGRGGVVGVRLVGEVCGGGDLLGDRTSNRKREILYVDCFQGHVLRISRLTIPSSHYRLFLPMGKTTTFQKVDIPLARRAVSRESRYSSGETMKK